MDPWMPTRLKSKCNGEGKEEEEDEYVDSAWIKYLKTVFDDTGYSVIWKIKIFQILIGLFRVLNCAYMISLNRILSGLLHP
jgi:hypothetical protein